MEKRILWRDKSIGTCDHKKANYKQGHFYSMQWFSWLFISKKDIINSDRGEKVENS